MMKLKMKQMKLKNPKLKLNVIYGYNINGF